MPILSKIYNSCNITNTVNYIMTGLQNMTSVRIGYQGDQCRTTCNRSLLES